MRRVRTDAAKTHPRQSADVVLVAVRDDDSLDLVAILVQKGRVRQNLRTKKAQRQRVRQATAASTCAHLLHAELLEAAAWRGRRQLSQRTVAQRRAAQRTQET